MKRRTLLTLGVVGGAAITIAGVSLALVQPARSSGRLSDKTRIMLAAVAEAVIASLLPNDKSARTAALDEWLTRLEATLQAMPMSLQSEIDELLTIVTSTPGRRLLVGLGSSWNEVTPSQLSTALQAMRMSSNAMRQQAYHALRDITNATYFAGRSTWAAIGYPGPRDIAQAATT